MKKVPNLRFKEFSGEWKTCLLGKSIVLYDKDRKPIKEQERISGEYAYYGATGIIDYIDDYIFEGEYLLLGEDGANIVTRSAPLVYKTSGKFWVNNHAHIFKPKQDFNIDFMKQRLELINYVPYNTGTAQPKLNADSIKSIPFKAPEKDEQEKIAAFFSLIDKKIELQTEKVEELKNYKKGLMQKIFSQELRFKDENGNEYPEWEEVNLRKILKEVSEKTTVINQYEVISSTNNGLYLQKDYFNREIASKDNIGYKILKRNQIVLSPQNLWMGNINLNSKYDIGMVSPSYKIFDIKLGFDSSYIGFILRTNRAFYEYKQASEQGASIVRRNLNMDLFYDISFKLPCKVEQHMISKFINKIDFKIEQEMEKLDSLNKYKKGLLQQMFI